MSSLSSVWGSPHVFQNKANYETTKTQKSNLIGKDFNQTEKIVYLKTDDMLYSGGNGTGLSFYIKYADESTEDNPVVMAKGVDECGNEFEQKISINNINPADASIIEMRALEGHYNVDKGLGLSSLPKETGSMGFNDRSNFIEMFKNAIKDMRTLGRYDLSMMYTKNLQIYSNLPQKTSKNV